MRKRSKYRPKGVIPDTISFVLRGFMPVREHSKTTTAKIKNHQALLNMTNGTGTREDIDTIIGSMNVAEALIKIAGIGVEYTQEIADAQQAIFTMGQRGVAKDRFLFTGPEIKAINTGMDVHDAQLDVCTIGELEKALDFVSREIRAKRARAIS
jgi:hypothetical protein